MNKRNWFLGFLFLAFALAVAHSSVPHAHPKLRSGKELESNHHSHGHHHEHHSHHDASSAPAEPESLPVFSHFSNSDYICAAKYALQARQDFSSDYYLITAASAALLRGSVLKEAPIPRARELPDTPVRSYHCLRAPPFVFA